MSTASMPRVRLLDARELDDAADEAALRAHARRLAAGPHLARSYRYPYALVASHDEPVGIDIERVERCDEAFAELICTPAERALVAGAADPDALLSSLWSSKEALSKALGDALDYEPSRLESPLVWPDGASGPWRAERLTVPDGHVAWLCWRAATVAVD